MKNILYCEIRNKKLRAVVVAKYKLRNNKL